MSVDWNPSQYLQFREERAQPFRDLLAGVGRRPDHRVLDLGCGAGALTAELHETLSAVETVGVDNSPSMLTSAESHCRPGLRFQHGDLREVIPPWAPTLIFSNAALHWVADHPACLRRYYDLLAPGGHLAIQVPANHTHASHRIADRVASQAPFSSALGGYQRGQTVLEPERYAEVLYAIGFERRRVMLRVYEHLLPEPASVVEWVKGTTLLDFQRRLGEAEWEEFVDCYRDQLLAELPQQRPYLYTFRRILFWATKPDASR